MPSWALTANHIGNMATQGLVDLFARPFKRKLTVPPWSVYVAFFTFLAVTATFTLLVFFRFLTAAPCIDQTMDLHNLYLAYPAFDKCTFQYASDEQRSLSYIGISEGVGYTITYSFLSPRQMQDKSIPRPVPSLKPFYENQTCSITSPVNFTQITASMSATTFEVQYPWVQCGGENSSIFAQLSLRTIINRTPAIYAGLRALYLNTLYNGGFDKYAGSKTRSFITILLSTLNINVPTKDMASPISTSAYVKYQNGTLPRPYEQWYPTADDEPLQNNGASPIVARFLHDAALQYVSMGSNGSTEAFVKILENEITDLLVNGAIYVCQVCGSRNSLNSFFAAAPWAHLLATVIFFLFSKALQLVDQTPPEYVIPEGHPPAVSPAAKSEDERRKKIAGGMVKVGGKGKEEGEEAKQAGSSSSGWFGGFGNSSKSSGGYSLLPSTTSLKMKVARAGMGL